MSSTKTDDRTTKARIRDAAITCVAEHGVAAMTARNVAKTAGVSPGLVIHHFGSMEDLRAACDESVAARIRRIKEDAAAAGVAMDPMEALKQQSEGPSLTRYLAQVLTDSSPRVDALVDELVADAVDYSEQMVESGLMKPTAYPQGRAAILVMWSLGNLVLGRHLERLLGVDVTETPEDPTTASAYLAPTLELMHDGVMTDASFELMRDAFVTGEAISDEGKGAAS
ncbi:MAG: TetR family transcriptional regulator [Actinomycetota bacterium]|nr:TetR family transcriptional regulator [Actinomycetota bacterium]